MYAVGKQLDNVASTLKYADVSGKALTSSLDNAELPRWRNASGNLS